MNNENKYRNLRLLPTVFHQLIRENTTKLPSRQKCAVHLAKMAPRRRRACAGGHVTGYFAGGNREELERARQTQCCSGIIHLAKLNPNCHMNYLDYLKQK